MRIQSKLKNQGFTIIELVIATAVFSLVLVVIMTAFLNISRMFYKGVNITRTQEDGRNIVQSIADDIEFARAAPAIAATVNKPGPGYFCIGLHRYEYRVGYQVVGNSQPSDYGIRRETLSQSEGCNKTAAGKDDEELLDQGMQLNSLNIQCDGIRCTVSIHIIFYGGSPQGLFTPSVTAPNAECTGSLTDTQYCAAADYASTVLQRT